MYIYIYICKKNDWDILGYLSNSKLCYLFILCSITRLFGWSVSTSFADGSAIAGAVQPAGATPADDAGAVADSDVGDVPSSDAGAVDDDAEGAVPAHDAGTVADCAVGTVPASDACTVADCFVGAGT